jgi:hypothetical protein
MCQNHITDEALESKNEYLRKCQVFDAGMWLCGPLRGVVRDCPGPISAIETMALQLL